MILKRNKWKLWNLWMPRSSKW